MKIKCQVTWSRLGSGGKKSAIRLKHPGGLTDWIDVDKAPALMSFVELDEEDLKPRPVDGPTKFINFMKG